MNARTVPLSALSLIASPMALAQCAPSWLPGTGLAGHDGFARCAVAWDPDGNGPSPQLLVIGGEFSAVGTTLARNLAAWDGETWTPLGDPDQPVDHLMVYAGELIATGQFSSIGGVPAPAIARRNESGWSPMATDWRGAAHPTTYQGALIVRATYADWYTRIVRWDGVTWQSLGLPEGYGSGAMLEYKGNLYASVAIYDWNLGSYIVSIMRFDGQGWAPFTSVGNGYVLTFIRHNDTLVIGGSFNILGGTPIDGLALFNGTTLTELGGGVLGDVTSLATDAQRLIVGGSIYQVDELPARSIAVWDGANWGFLDDGLMGGVSALAWHQGKLAAAGHFRIPRVGGGGGIARWDGREWSGTASGFDGEVRCLEPFRDEIIIAGWFVSAGAPATSYIARGDGTSWRSVGGGTDDYVLDLTLHEDALIAGGLFSRAGETQARRVARWDGVQWQALGSGIGNLTESADVYAVESYKGEVVAGGDFAVAGGAQIPNLARWNGAVWRPLGSGLHQNAVVRDLHIYGDDLVAVGWLVGLPNAVISRWDGAAWRTLGSPPFDEYITAVANFGGELIAGGVHDVWSEYPRCARFDGAEWEILSDHPSQSARFASFIGYRGDLLASGWFTMKPGAPPAHSIARYEGSAWVPFAGEPLLSKGVADAGPMILHKGDLVVGGGFSTAAGRVSASVARWGCRCYADCDNSGTLGVSDLACFQTQFTSQHQYADCDRDGAFTIADFSCFQGRFAGGCR